jgi:GntR family phosphonate transport system transcriptional regulator
MSLAVDRTAEWRGVCAELRRRIDEGQLAPGAALPTLASLARETGLTRHGARRVMARLREEGRVQSWQGLGHRVAERRIDYPIQRRTRFSGTLRDQGRAVSAVLIAGRVMTAGPRLARDMRLAPGAEIHRAEILRRVEGRPALLTRSHFPARLGGILDAIAASGSVTAALAAHGVADYAREETRIEARLLRAHEALVLDIPTSQPVIVTTGANTDALGAVVELSHSVWRADRVTFAV